MKKFLFIYLLVSNCVCGFSQSPMTIRSVVCNDNISESTCQYVENKLKPIISSNPNWEISDWSRLVLAVNIHPTRKDVTPTTPVKVSMEFDVFFSIGDMTDNHIFKSAKITLSGIGSSEERAYTAAFKSLTEDNSAINNLLNETRPIVETYYSTHCKQIIQKASTLKSTNQYEEAIYLLTSIPDNCTECYEKCMKLTATVYKQKIDFEGNQLLKQARVEWMNGQDKEAADRVAEVMRGIDPNSSAFSEVKKLQNVITNKLNADEKKEWELKIKQMEAQHETTLSVIDAAKAIGVAWLQSRPQTITRTIIRAWF